MTETNPGLHHWETQVTLPRTGYWTFTIEAWTDEIATWLGGTRKKLDAGLDISLELEEGARLFEQAARRVPQARAAEQERATELGELRGTLEERAREADELRATIEDTLAAVATVVFAASPALAQGGDAAPTDPQIAAIVVAANQVDIDAAKMAKSRTKNKDVKEFANTMIRDHEAVNKQAKALVKKLKVKPEPNPTSKSLADGGKQNVAELKKLKGAALDKAYVDHEVAYHQQVLDAIQNTLLPSAKNPELKALLEKATPAFQAHLDHAKQLQTKLGGGQ
jgi:putative membrane protein